MMAMNCNFYNSQISFHSHNVTIPFSFSCFYEYLRSVLTSLLIIRLTDNPFFPMWFIQSKYGHTHTNNTCCYEQHFLMRLVSKSIVQASNPTSNCLFCEIGWVKGRPFLQRGDAYCKKRPCLEASIDFWIFVATIFTF